MVAEPQALESFLFQVSQPELEVALFVHLDQVRWPNIQERLEAPCPLLVEELLLLVDPNLLPDVVILLVIELEVKEVEPPRLFVV
jgi:hypothetical protein